MKRIIVALLVASFVMIGCKNEGKKEVETKKEVTAANIQEASFKISGMTCEVGCAKTIQSKLAKKEGVVDAKVVFADSIATVKFDASKTNQKDLMAYVETIADGKTYKTCPSECKKTKEECSSKKGDKPVSCSADCKKECGKDGKVCDAACKKECSKKDKTACTTECKKECCAKA